MEKVSLKLDFEGFIQAAQAMFKDRVYTTFYVVSLMELMHLAIAMYQELWSVLLMKLKLEKFIA